MSEGHSSGRAVDVTFTGDASAVIRQFEKWRAMFDAAYRAILSQGRLNRLMRSRPPDPFASRRVATRRRR